MLRYPQDSKFSACQRRLHSPERPVPESREHKLEWPYWMLPKYISLYADKKHLAWMTTARSPGIQKSNSTLRHLPLNFCHRPATEQMEAVQITNASIDYSYSAPHYFLVPFQWQRFWLIAFWLLYMAQIRNRYFPSCLGYFFFQLSSSWVLLYVHSCVVLLPGQIYENFLLFVYWVIQLGKCDEICLV